MTCSKNNNTSRGCCFTRNKNNEPLAYYKSGCQKMDVHDYLRMVPNPRRDYNIFEIQFKNTRKSFFINKSTLQPKKGDLVVVESNPGYNIGIVTMCSDLVGKQMFHKGFNPTGFEFQKIIRTPTSTDITKWEEAIEMENNTMVRSRQICSKLGLEMKIGDVEFQADKMKAIFYYIADGRVDFRELIKILAEQFRIRIEMKQIGARQEAGLIGGIGSCGRELCCSTWQNKFHSVSINAARVQDITPNPQKLAGQCNKLKCCLNYELDSYLDARESLPRVHGTIETLQANYHLVKTDALRGIMYFSSDPHNPALQIPLNKDKVRQVLSMIRKGQKPDDLRSLSIVSAESQEKEPAYENVVGQDSLTRFDRTDRNRRPNRSNSGSRGGNSENRSRGGNSDNRSRGNSSENRSRGDESGNNPRNSNSGNRSQNREANNNTRNDNSENRSPNREANNNTRNDNSENRSQNRNSNNNSRNNNSGNRPQNRNSNNNSRDADSANNNNSKAQSDS